MPRRIRDSDLKKPTKSEVDSAYQKSLERNPNLEDFNPDRSKQFKHETVDLVFDDSMTTISNNRSYFEWNWGSWTAKPTRGDCLKMLNFLMDEAEEKWGVGKPLRGAIHEVCPFFHEFPTGHLISQIMGAVNDRNPGGGVQFINRRDLIVDAIDPEGVRVGTSIIKNVYGHTVPFTFVDVD